MIFGAGPGAHAASLFAATYPDRTRALILWDFYVWAGGAFQPTDLELLGRTWGTEAAAAAAMAQVAPSMVGDRAFLRWYAKVQRHFVPPDVAADLIQSAIDTDVRMFLSSSTSAMVGIVGALAAIDVVKGCRGSALRPIMAALGRGSPPVSTVVQQISEWRK